MLDSLIDSKKLARYAPTFLGLDSSQTDFKTSAAVVLPVPFDGTSTYAKGADRGPEALLRASTQVELFDIETSSEYYLNGIHTLAPLQSSESVEELVRDVGQVTEALFEREKLPVLIGGEHSVSIGAFVAAAKRFSDITIVQLDAHADTRDVYSGSRFNHACVMARAREIAPIVQLGIRSMDSTERGAIDTERVFFAHEMHRQHIGDWCERAIACCTKRVYVTIDLDCFDSGFMPSTGTPEPGGLSWLQVTSFLRALSAACEVVGFDVVELLPRADFHAPDFSAAKLLYQFLSFIGISSRG